MGDYFASENIPYTQEQIDWLCRKKTLLEKLKEFLLGKETIEKHFQPNYPYPRKGE
jgi:hypothetical protein